ncbi:NIPSNAP protein [Parapedobacter luteus]|uniref:NIPSNAP protein n=1 Tax=Parapedobacter luteus TaxID=623280 RepID=A0A1T5FL88_9SPHI|nr:NIPSNAP family protein [Parapedobacter luteus]SKB96858.1 NIPSNAP protein [Parapedobacter luteus]
MKALLFLLLFSALVGHAQQRQQVKGNPVHQLRIYEIFEHNKDAFHQRFNDHAQRIMKQYDFHIIAMWETNTNGKLAFVYLLEWPDVQVLQASWDKFMADEEWARIKQETSRLHGQLVGEIQDIRMAAVPYSPLMNFKEIMDTARDK